MQKLKNILNKIKNYFFLTVIGVLTLVILLQRCGSGNESNSTLKPREKVKIDWRVIKKTEVHNVPVYYFDTTYLPGDPIYMPDTSYAGLLKQYKELFEYYTMRVVYKDTIAVDTFGNIVIIDTVNCNQLQPRVIKHDYKIPITTITKYETTRQLYFGGGIAIDYPIGFNNIHAGFMYKDKKDRVFGLSAGVTPELKPFFSIDTYWKIKLRK